MAGLYPHAHDLKMVAPLPRSGVGKVKPQKRPQRKPEQPKQAPIQFHDAIGRKFFFPYEMVATWSVSRQYSLFDITLVCSLFCHGADDLSQGLERLVREAFIHITVIGPHVYEGHYDLVGPDGDIILPSVWEHVVVPGMSVTMHMWPLPEGTAGPEPEDEETRAAKEAGAHKPVRARMDADDPRWIPPPTVALEGVFGFLDSAGMANDTHSLHLALFELRFDGNIQTAQVTASCDLSPTTDSVAVDAEWKVGFFRRSSAGVVDWDVLDGTGFDKSGAQQTVLEVKDSERYGVAILLRRRQAEQDAPFPVIFNIAYVHHGGYGDEEQVTQNILPGRSESTPWTPLSWAAANGWEDCVKVLLREKGIAQLDHNGRSALSWAAGGGQAMVTKLLLDEPGIQVDEADIGGRTPLSWAAANGHANTINLLLAQRKVNINRPDCQGRIPLSWAAGNGHVDAVIILISNAKKNGLIVAAPIGDNGNFDSSPLFCAAKNEQQSTLRILVEEDLQLPETYRQSTRLALTQFYLHKAAQQGWCIFTKLLIEKKVQIDCRDPDYDDRTPLCVAAEQGHAEVVESLLKAGAARNHQTSRARDTPLGLAIRSGHEAAVKVLLNAGAQRPFEERQGGGSDGPG
jgi:ankyrin repeat protein